MNDKPVIIQIMEFVFSGFLHWAGTVVLLNAFFGKALKPINALAKALTAYSESKKK